MTFSVTVVKFISMSNFFGILYQKLLKLVHFDWVIQRRQEWMSFWDTVYIEIETTDEPWLTSHLNISNDYSLKHWISSCRYECPCCSRSDVNEFSRCMWDLYCSVLTMMIENISYVMDWFAWVYIQVFLMYSEL